MNRFNILAILAITLGTATLGTNSSLDFSLRQGVFNDRNSYCEAARREGKKNFFETYREKKIHFSNLPEFVSLRLIDNESQTIQRMKQLHTTRELLNKQKAFLLRSPASTPVLEWKIKTEIPQQIEQVEQESTRLRLRLKDLQERRFSELEMSNTYLEAREEAFSGEAIPFYGFQLILKDSVIGSELTMNPIWITKGEGKDWSFRKASSEPIIKLKNTMITERLKSQFSERKLSSDVPLKSTSWQFTRSGNLVFIDSPDTPDWLFSVLDLDCGH